MRKLLLMLCVGLIVVGLCAGCGSDTKQAKEDVQQGEAKAAKVVQLVNDKMVSSMTTPFDSVADPAKFKTEAEKSKEFYNELSATADEAIASYNNVKTLKGVPDHVAYADLMIQVMGYYKQQTAVLIKFMDEAIALVNAGDSAGLQQLSTQLKTDIKNINAKASGITEKINEARSKIGLDGNP
jgi:hypothetical protein